MNTFTLSLTAAAAIGFLAGALWQRAKYRRELRDVRIRLAASHEALARAVEKQTKG